MQATPGSRRFDGFPAEAFDFFARVAADTSWGTVEPLQGLHGRAVRGPMCELVAELEPEFGAGKVYRLHRAANLWVRPPQTIHACACSVTARSWRRGDSDARTGWDDATPSPSSGTRCESSSRSRSGLPPSSTTRSSGRA